MFSNLFKVVIKLSTHLKKAQLYYQNYNYYNFICYTVKLGYNELGYNKLLLIANKFNSLVGFQSFVHLFPGYNEHKPGYSEQMILKSKSNKLKEQISGERVCFVFI